MKPKLKWILLTTFAFEILLVASNSLPTKFLIPAIITTEGTALALTLSILIPACASIVKRARARKEPMIQVVHSELKGIVPHPALQLLKGELGILSSIGRFITNNPDIPSGATAIKYGNDFRRMGAILIFIAFLEIALVDMACLKLAPDLIPLRIALVVLSVYMMIWIIGLVLTTKEYPHFVKEESITLRFGCYQAIEIPLDSIADVVCRNEDCPRSKLLFEEDGALWLNNNMGANNLFIYLLERSALTVNGEVRQSTTRSLSCSVDCPEEARTLILDAKTRAKKA